MNPRKHLKFISLISVLSLILIGIIFGLTQNIMFALLVSLIADSVQIVSYLIWLVQKEMPMEQVPKQVEVVYKYVTKKEERSRVKEELVSRLVNEGAIRESELYTLIRNKEAILAFPYGEGISSKIKSLCGLESQPLATLLERCGFVRATGMQNLMVVFTENLPRSLRSIDNLNAFIKRELPKIWEQISNKIKKEFPADQYPKKYEKWRSGEGFSAMYTLSKSMAQDFIIDYINKESFTPEFKKHIWGLIDWKKLRDIIKKRRHKVKEIISKISIDFLLGDIPRNVRKIIEEHEDDIKKSLGIEVFTDYRLIEQNKMSKVLLNFLPATERGNVDHYSSAIITESKNCYDLLKELGISF